YRRDITEDWLSKRGQYDFVPSTGETYHKVLELYCLHIPSPPPRSKHAPSKSKRKSRSYLPHHSHSINRQ
ncbi:hypothetical protein DFH29DRAFT_976752, partial [Suillus ampliporus]